MPLAKGFLLLTCFSITCGVLTACNAALLHRIGAISEGVLSLSLALVLAFLETLALLAFVDWWFLRARKSRERLDKTNPHDEHERGQHARAHRP